MFAYRHGFHAGNKADVFKHSVLIASLIRFCAKEKPFLYFDSHAGAGRYNLDSDWSLQTGEALEGIGSLLDLLSFTDGTVVASPAPVPAAVEAYRNLCAHLYSERIYPGSPEIAARFSRPGDSLVLCELHPTEIDVLRQNMKNESRRKISPCFGKTSGKIHIHHRDGFEALTGLLPPGKEQPKRGLVLVDPSYEIPADYRKVSEILPRAVEKWNTGVFILWYPLVGRRINQIEKMKESLYSSLSSYFSSCSRHSGGQDSNPENEEPFFFSELEFAGKEEGGMYGCGLLVVRPQWNFALEVEGINKYLHSVLAG